MFEYARDKVQAHKFERRRILDFLRAEARKGTADFEFKLNKIIAAIERGEHE